MTGAERSKFQQLAFTHAAMMAGEAAMVVALADSFFFDVDPNGARSRVLGFLLVSFAPFLVVAPMIGPAIDRIRGGRRLIVQVTAAARIALQLLMIQFADDIILFPLVFVALILQKTYAVSKSALVPAVVRSELELVEANSKLGVIAGVAGTIAVIPAGALQLGLGSRATFAYGAIVFGVALAMSLALPQEGGVRTDRPSAASADVATTGLQLAWVAMLILRACAGFMLFHLAFWFRGQEDERVLLGLAVGLSSAGTLVGNAIAPRLRKRIHEERNARSGARDAGGRGPGGGDHRRPAHGNRRGGGRESLRCDSDGSRSSRSCSAMVRRPTGARPSPGSRRAFSWAGWWPPFFRCCWRFPARSASCWSGRCAQRPCSTTPLRAAPTPHRPETSDHSPLMRAIQRPGASISLASASSRGAEAAGSAAARPRGRRRPG